ncbi:WYL domain-containing protein [Cohnella sp. CFH 77786]|uniref:WYL domain-containing protein n=1 Tax=Cohnella sp. CFH 77786 TaxID=2662265 RepID=UPI001C60E28B|nr:WYL domain-containing protein [Cohnella sp. CFH 77786]MBW5445771.1 WYL domain-containing protein [Cohnella sp. CFH 77786]
MDKVERLISIIVKRRFVSFDYIDKNGTVTNRIVEPYGLHFSESSWYLKGFCLDRQGYRTFKLSRIDHLTVGERTFTPRDDWPEQVHEASYQPQLVTIKALISPSIKDHFMERYGRKSIETDGAEWLLATLHVPHNSTGFQFLASFGTQLKIVEPQTYVDDFRKYLYNMMENYS